VAPEVTIGSVVIDLPLAFLTVAREVKEKRFTPRVIKLGSETGVITLVLNPVLQSRVPPAAMRALDSARAALGTASPLSQTPH
jgi:hypothetical protein